MNDDSDPSEANEPFMFRFVAPGMRLTYELESIGQLRASLGHSIDFCPVLTSVGWNQQKQTLCSLRLKHSINDVQEISRCLLDRDEVTAWSALLNSQIASGHCCDSESFLVNDFEYATRHGIRWTWSSKGIFGSPVNVLYIASKQSALFTNGFFIELLEIFDTFETLCHKYQ
ncbi:hypothetical protein [Schlesneria paludicola]|uniref:hypothetical protein n=1 Tax=Schlesneria paludicola TaxID=360056 RepID=UPI00029A9F36|nr:hypothetical protein [Schlesneria paludicola]